MDTLPITAAVLPAQVPTLPTLTTRPEDGAALALDNGTPPLGPTQDLTPFLAQDFAQFLAQNLLQTRPPGPPGGQALRAFLVGREVLPGGADRAPPPGQSPVPAGAVAPAAGPLSVAVAAETRAPAPNALLADLNTTLPLIQTGLASTVPGGTATQDDQQTALRFGAGVPSQNFPALPPAESGSELVRDATAIPAQGNLQAHTGGPPAGGFAANPARTPPPAGTLGVPRLGNRLDLVV